MTRTIAAILIAAPACAAPAPSAPAAREAPFVTVAEALTMGAQGEAMEVAPRIFTAPDLPRWCAGAEEAADLRSEAPPVRIEAGGRQDLRDLRIRALNSEGRIVPRVPLAIEIEETIPPIAATGSDDADLAAGGIRVLRPGRFRIRVRTICGEGAHTLIFDAEAHAPASPG